MGQLTLHDIEFILESLSFTRMKFDNYPVGQNGYPTYQFKLARLKEVDDITGKLRAMRRKLKGNNGNSD